VPLEVTLQSAGYTGKRDRLRYIDFSPADPARNKALHAKTNETLLSTILKDAVGHCIHITGEMRALTDPFHRRLCAELAKTTSSRFDVVCDLPEEHSRTPADLGQRTAASWSSKGWAEKLSAIQLIGKQVVNVHSYQTLSAIQYTVFGNKFVQLQEKHQDDGSSMVSRPKRIWLIESEELCSHLTEKAVEILKSSRDIPENLYSKFFTDVSGVTSQNLLHILSGCESLHAEVLLNADVLDFDPSAPEILKSLVALRLVSLKGELASITEDGLQFASYLK
jgi:hypothetical protein